MPCPPLGKSSFRSMFFWGCNATFSRGYWSLGTSASSSAWSCVDLSNLSQPKGHVCYGTNGHANMSIRYVCIDTWYYMILYNTPSNTGHVGMLREIYPQQFDNHWRQSPNLCLFDIQIGPSKQNFGHEPCQLVLRYEGIPSYRHRLCMESKSIACIHKYHMNPHVSTYIHMYPHVSTYIRMYPHCIYPHVKHIIV